ncbi:hypothetical protein ACFSYF_18465 [Paracoccus cavernae]|uniref:hypothetical protein n=1 Tax=Paracoccus cavernae TaxID=1571207 RepID=UPI00364058D4
MTERVPVVLWRHSRGIELLDKTGHRVASATSRDVRKDLPMIAGEGADKAAAEAMLLLDAAGPILPACAGWSGSESAAGISFSIAASASCCRLTARCRRWSG